MFSREMQLVIRIDTEYMFESLHATQILNRYCGDNVSNTSYRTKKNAT